MKIEELKAPFPQTAISWRCQRMNALGNQALALAYLDARDVMNRLDEVCGPDKWMAEHYDCGGGRMGCKIGIYTGTEYGQWVWKSDGAGETQIEAEKGAFSGAFKRAAVMWGVGRYLYDLDAPWVPCESYKKGDRLTFKQFTDSPWNYVAKKEWTGPLNKEELAEKLKALNADLRACEDMDTLDCLLITSESIIEQCKEDLPNWYHGNVAGKGLAVAIEKHKERLSGV